MSLFLVLCLAGLAACDYPKDEQVDQHEPQTERVAEFLRYTKVRLQPALHFGVVKGAIVNVLPLSLERIIYKMMLK